MIGRIIKVDHDIITTIEKKRLVWYGHIQRMGEDRWQKKVLNWIPPERLKRGRPPKSWKGEIQQTMENRGLKDGDNTQINLFNLLSFKKIVSSIKENRRTT